MTVDKWRLITIVCEIVLTVLIVVPSCRALVLSTTYDGRTGLTTHVDWRNSRRQSLFHKPALSVQPSWCGSRVWRTPCTIFEIFDVKEYRNLGSLALRLYARSVRRWTLQSWDYLFLSPIVWVCLHSLLAASPSPALCSEKNIHFCFLHRPNS